MTTATETRALWFLGTRVSLPVAAADGGDGISLIESVAPRGDSPPLHVHASEDEAFHVLEGTLRLRVGGDELVLEAGESALAVKGVPHTYRVETPRARWLVVTTHGDFERFVRAIGRPAEHDGLPPAAGPPSADEQRALAEIAAAHRIELVGPPLAAHD
jgi:quercetin dioxygenase-like cupin family protein